MCSRTFLFAGSGGGIAGILAEHGYHICLQVQEVGSRFSLDFLFNISKLGISVFFFLENNSSVIPKNCVHENLYMKSL